MIDVQLPHGLTARPPAPPTEASAHQRDLEAATAVLRADEAVTAEPLTTVGDLAGDWRRPSVDLPTGVVLVVDGDDVVAYADQHQGRAWVAVHPDAHGRGIGTALRAWTEASARTQGQDLVGQTVNDLDQAGQAVLRAAGYDRRWTSWIFEIDLTAHPGDVELPDGFAIRPIRRPEEEAAAHDVVETAFGEWPDRGEATPLADWVAANLDRDDDLVLVCTDPGDRVVGVAVGVADDGEGWIQQLAVAADQRGRGLARALLQASFGRFAAKGCTTAGLSTDSRTGAKALYEHVGMHVTSNWTRWTRAVDPPAAP